MSVSLDQLDDFHRFAQQKLQAGGAESLEELCDLWRIEHPTADDEAAIHQAIRQGLADIQTGRHRPAADVMDDLCKTRSSSFMTYELLLVPKAEDDVDKILRYRPCGRRREPLPGASAGSR